MTRSALCTACGEPFDIEKVLGRPPARCKPCDRKYHRERHYRWRQENPDKWQAVQTRANAKRLANPEHRREKREAAILRTYGITAVELAELTEVQDGLCAICQRPPRGRPNGRARSDHVPSLHVDHNHKTGKVRGLLCGNCNTMIGLANEDPVVLQAAIEYLGGPHSGIDELGEDAGGLLETIEPT